MSPERVILAEKSPDGIIRCLVGIADESVERRGVPTFDKGNLPGRRALPGMRLDETVEVAGHIPFSLGEQVIPCLTFFLEQFEKTVFLVNHGCAHHPGLEQRKKINAEMIFEIRLKCVLNGNMHPPFAVGKSFRGGTRLRTEMLRMRNHGFGPDKIRTRHITVTMSAGRIAECRPSADFVCLIDTDFQTGQTMFHSGFHIFGPPFKTGIECVNRAGPFMPADTVKHIAGCLHQCAAFITGCRFHINMMVPAEFPPARQQSIGNFLAAFHAPSSGTFPAAVGTTRLPRRVRQV